ncbi:alpha-glucan family phosphorylase [Breznakiella homolactica]|uniref:glycogen phosphorylase n=1 Tax=Breznakiella homolactica TaxID=2798577 RepID=A0A7T7XN61_9SPIR|nr:alpha-glucan family phosphorylase [Breznakiella homolactica]QQO09421.1 alpha-glucan family phosphorylase [Breznakiella homolactica]
MNISTYTVKPKLPAPLKPLEEMARNLWLSWNFDAIQLFIRLDYDAWLQSQQSPIRTLGMVSQERLEKVAKDDSYLAALKEVYGRFQRYRKGDTWYRGTKKDVVAYFSMEYGMDVSLPIYSGGLGILSGDHMKTSSDMGLPLVGIGLLYRQGYFKQYLNADGFQQESYPENDWYNMPVELKTDKSGNPLKISVDMAGRNVIAQIWEVKVGRSSLYLLDTNIEENAQDMRNVTATLYGGDKETRIQQEILLGIGGIRALRALGINPAATHMNEGHSAFLGLERVREVMEEKGFSFAEAKEVVWPTNIFTTHTPVPAGNERFEIALVDKYMHQWTQILGISWKDFLALGRERPDDDHETFCMTVLALKMSAYSNGVSRLHGKVSRDMWKGLWPGLPESEIPIGHVTNGVHPRTWVSSSMTDLLDRYFGPHFDEEPTDLEIWNRMDRISDEELWRTHERRRERLVAAARDRIRQHLKRTGAVERKIQQAEDALSPYALTIAFARRFATYKRGNLLLRDPERLLRLLKDTERPVQLIFAGKAHPMDMPGKELIREIIHFAEKYDVTSRIVFLENYDMTIARYLTSGADLWLNTPRRPLEASGTSGMKASMNGVLNCSVLDGWWDEAYNPEVGWAIGQGEQYEDPQLQDDVESKALYDLLEREIIPMFYQRGRDNLPREWIRKMKNCMREIGQSMSSHRMLMDYSNQFYFPALKNYRRMVKDDFAEAKSLAGYLGRLRSSWNGLRITKVESNAKPVMLRGDSLTVNAYIDLGNLKPEELQVELYHGRVSNQNATIEHARHTEMRAVSNDGSVYRYQLKVECTDTGCQGHTVRILPKHSFLVHPYRSGLIKWA